MLMLKGMFIMSKPITENQLHNIQLLLDKGFKREEIANIIGCGTTTVRRVQDGTHALLQKHTEEKPIDFKATTDIEQKLDRIIELLKELKSMWG